MADLEGGGAGSKRTKTKDTEFPVPANAGRPQLGRTGDPPWSRYTLSDIPFSREARPRPPNRSDPRPMKTAG